MSLKLHSLCSTIRRRLGWAVVVGSLVTAGLAGSASAEMCNNGKFAMKGTKLNLSPAGSAVQDGASNDRATLSVGQAATMASDWEKAAGKAARQTFNSQSQAMQQNGQDLTGDGASARQKWDSTSGKATTNIPCTGLCCG